jgi:peptidoglycan/xylan/chitin deacetylase (PgdA/CDA1 family)
LRRISTWPVFIALLLAVACSDPASRMPAPAPPSPPAQVVTQTPAPAPTATATPPPTATPEPTPTPTPRISRAPGEVTLGNAARAEMALTFDCGASGIPTPAILEALRKASVRSTFFITGQWATRYPALTREIAQEHEIANHSWSHPDFRNLSDARILDEMRRTDDLLSRISGTTTKPFWRAPFGSRDRRILTAIQNDGWPYHIYWSADSGDWLAITPAQVRANVVRAARNGAIIVQHCGSTQTAQVLPAILDDLQTRGFRLVTVSDLLRD